VLAKFPKHSELVGKIIVMLILRLKVNDAKLPKLLLQREETHEHTPSSSSSSIHI
jgi:hypothetical protein